MGMEREGRDKLTKAREDLREASVSLVGWLFSILGSGFKDENGLVGKVFDILGECWEGADELERYLLRTWAIRAWNADDIGIIVGKVESVTGKLLAAGLLNEVAKHDRRFVSLEEKAFVADRFCSYAPEPFGFSVGLVGNAATSLAQLKAAVLPTDSAEGSTSAGDSNTLGSGSSLRRVALTSIDGEGGVGKTSTWKLLCVDEDVRAYFSGGAILWIDVGKDATEEKVKGELESVVRKCGGGRSAELMRRSSCDVKAAVDIARLFFSTFRVLLIVDNVWETPAGSTVTSWAETLSKIVSGPGSAVIITTRFISLSRSPGFSRVKLGRLDLSSEESPDWRIAENLYDALLNEDTKVQSGSAYKKSRRRALILSCGLPLGITTFAGLVQSYCELGDDVETVLSNIEQRVLGLADKVVGEDLKASTGHPGLFAAMEESLSYLDQRERKACRVKLVPLSAREDVHGNDIRAFSSNYDALAGQSLSARYAALEVMLPSSTSISFPILFRLWHVSSIAEAKSIALLFVNMGLDRIEGGEEKAFILHDLQYTFCARACERSAGATIGDVLPCLGAGNGHALLLSSCESLLRSEVARDGSDVGWVEFCFGDAPVSSEQVLRRYLGHNLFRHLCAAAAVGADSCGVRRTIVNVLTDLRWLRGRIAVDGRSSVVWDFWYACTARGSAESGDEAMLLDSGTNSLIRAVWDCLLLLPDDGWMESDGRLAGCIVQAAQSCVERGGAGMDDYFVNTLTFSVASQLRGAWFEPIYGCSRSRDQGVIAQAFVGSGGEVEALAALGDGVHFVSRSEDGVVRVHDSVYLQAVLELKGLIGDVECIGAAKKEGVDGSFLVFYGDEDGTVGYWDVGLDLVAGVVEDASAVIGECGSCVTSLAVSDGGDVIAAGCYGMVFVWKRQGEDVALGFELVTSFSCSAAEEDSDRLCGVTPHTLVVVSRAGDFVVAGEKNGGVALWSNGGSGSEGTVTRCCSSDESNAELRHVLLSEDESSLSFVFNKPAGCEVWDVASRRSRSPRVPLSDFNVLTCATLSRGAEACAEGSGAGGVLVAGGWDESGRDYFSLHSPSNGFEVLSAYTLASPPRSVCCTSFRGDRRILVGCDDGCVRMLDAGVCVARDGAESYREGARSLGSGGSDVSDAPELEEVRTVAVMPAAGLVVAGHTGGRFSLWRAESGEFFRSFGDERGDWVMCVDISADESLAVSGHGNGVALVWDASTWECRFALEGHSEQVVCATISADAKRIVTVDSDGELRFWGAEIGGAAMSIIETGLEFSVLGSGGAISPDGGLFLWASRGDDYEWRGKLIDLRAESVILQSKESRHFDWDAFFQELMSSEAFDGEEEMALGFGAVFRNRSVELGDVDSGQKSADGLRISSGGERGDFLPRIDCTLRSVDGEAASAAASLGFDSNVWSIAAGWIPTEPGVRRRAVVVCWIKGRSYPAIMHFYPANKL